MPSRLPCYKRSFMALLALRKQRSDEFQQSLGTNGLFDEISAFRQISWLGSYAS